MVFTVGASRARLMECSSDIVKLHKYQRVRRGATAISVVEVGDTEYSTGRETGFTQNCGQLICRNRLPSRDCGTGYSRQET